MEFIGIYFGIAFVMLVYHMQTTSRLIDLEYELSSVKKLLVKQNKYLIDLEIAKAKINGV